MAKKKKPRKKRIVLQPAFTWMCPICRRRNYIKAEVVKFTEEEIRKLLDEVDEDIEISDLEFCGQPELVVCHKCCEKYKVKFV